jgi:hypothetical protein
MNNSIKHCDENGLSVNGVLKGARSSAQSASGDSDSQSGTITERLGHVLIIVENQPVPFDRRVWSEATALSRNGYTVSVICPKGKNASQSFEIIDGIHIYRHWMPREASGAAGSRLVPQAMALRYAAGDECWRPSKAYASIIIDDPLLRKNYGFLNFESLLRLAEQYNFHATIAFIPHNFRRNSSRITRMFQENVARLSICFHGNDHTEGEFASSDSAFLNTLLSVAEDRMKSHFEATGLPCDRVMVFPQGGFSVEAMKTLKAHNVYAAVNTVPHPAKHPVELTIGELAQPAVLRYGGFPLFIRKPIRQTHSQDIAFNLFFGRPVLIVEHHDLFEHPEPLVEIVTRINSMAPEVCWCNLATVASNSILTRRAPDGTHHVRAYSGTVRISNDLETIQRYLIEWGSTRDGASIEQVLMDGTPCRGFEVDDAGLRLSVELAPGSSRTFSLVHRNDQATVINLGLRWKARAFLRRRLSEVRDNYLSKNQRLLSAAKAFQRRFMKV